MIISNFYLVIILCYQFCLIRYFIIILTIQMQIPNSIIYICEKLSELEPKFRQKAQKTILIVGQDIQADFKAINAIANWMEGKDIQYQYGDDRQGYTYAGNQSQLTTLQLNGFQFKIIIKQINKNRIVGFSGQLWHNEDFKEQKKYFAQIFDLAVSFVIQKTQKLKIYSPLIARETALRPFLQNLRNKKQNLEFLHFENEIHNNILIISTKIDFSRHRDKFEEFKTCDYLTMEGTHIKDLNEFFNDGFFTPQHNVSGNLIKIHIDKNPKFGEQIQQHSMLNTQKIVQKLFVPHQKIIKQFLLNKQVIGPESEQIIEIEQTDFIITNEYNFNQIFDKTIMEIDIKHFRPIEIRDYMRDRVFSKLKYFDKQNWKISQHQQINQKLVKIFYLSQLRKMLREYTELNFFGPQNLTYDTQQLKVFFQRIASLDKILESTKFKQQQLKPQYLQQYVGAAVALIQGLLIYKKLTKSNLGLPINMGTLFNRAKFSRRKVLETLISLPLQKKQTINYYQTIITIINDNTAKQNQQTEIDQQLDRKYKKYKLKAQQYKTEVICRDYMNDQDKIVDAIKILVYEVYTPVLNGLYSKDMDEPINLHEILSKIANLLRVVGRPDIAQFIHKKQKQIKKYEQCVFEESYFYENDKKGDFYFRKAPYFQKQGYPDIARNLYQLAFENYTKPAHKIQAKLKLYNLAKNKYQVDHDELLKLDVLQQKYKQIKSKQAKLLKLDVHQQKQKQIKLESESAKQDIFEEYLQQEIEPEFYNQINKLKPYNLFRDSKIYLSVRQRDSEMKQIMKMSQGQTSRIGKQIVW